MTTAIEWAEETWNPLAGCSVVSPGCAHCYAMREAGGWLSRFPKYRGLTLGSQAGQVWTGEVRLWEPALDQPLRWTKPRMIFVNSMSDLFHEHVPTEWIDRVWAVMRDCPQHTFLVLTKRADHMRIYAQIRTPPLPNVWLGVSVEDQRRADERLFALSATPAAKRFASFEPLLGLVDPARLRETGGLAWNAFTCDLWSTTTNEIIAGPPAGHGPLDWVIAGGESGPRARPMHPAWARSIRDQCQAAGVPFFFKQWGEWAPAPEDMNYAEGAALACRDSRVTLIRVGKKRAGRLLDGRVWNEYPA
jgi:protein gp37